MAAVARVFVSSAGGALAPYRQAAVQVCHRLGLLPVHQEEFAPDRRPPLDVCRQLVTGSDVVVLLLAHRYGSRPPGKRRSYTELEYRWARADPEISLLPFVVDPAYPWDPADVDRGDDAKALRAFTAEVTTAHVVRRFGELAAFREDLLLALRGWSAPEEAAPALGTRRKGAVRPPPPDRPHPPQFHSVPPYVGGAPFTGRAADLAVLDDWAASTDPLLVVEAIGGAGKSALTWEWAQHRATGAMDGLAGRLWWSFYDGSASISRFLRELLLYTGVPRKQVMASTRTELAEQAVAVLRTQPYLVVLDGVERLLAAYHRFDPSKLRDDEVQPTRRALIEAHADTVMRALAGVGPSKVLVSTRLMPEALEGRFGRPAPGVRHLRLPGLTDSDTVALLGRLGVQGSEASIGDFFGRLDNHPLTIGVVAGLVNDYRPAPGGFDQWVADPAAGGALALPDLDLVQRRAHILDAALSGLSDDERRVLGAISVAVGAVDWATVQATNPFWSEPPPLLRPPGARNSYLMKLEATVRDRRYYGRKVKKRTRRALEEARREAEMWGQREKAEHDERMAGWQAREVQAAARLDRTLQELEDRGLLWWDRPSNTYDLHPVVRAYVHDQLAEDERIQANERVRNHFEALPPDDLREVTSVEDLRRSIVIFRSLVGGGRLNEACGAWRRGLDDALGERLGAYATVVELLSPLADHPYQPIQADLAAAYTALGRHAEALHHEEGLLAAALAARSADDVRTCLLRLATDFEEVGALMAAARCLDLRAASGSEDAAQCLARAGQAVRSGQAAEARALLAQARALPAPRGYPWFAGDLQLWELTLDDGNPALLRRIDAAAATLSLWVHRRWLARLRYEALDRLGQAEAALDAALQWERLERNAGLETVPAASAVQLALLGRDGEATAAVEETLARLPLLHDAARPHLAVARALQRLGRVDEAVEHAELAYRQGWCDGPPFCRAAALAAATNVLAEVGRTPPTLAATEPRDVHIPLEVEIRAFIDDIGARRPGVRNR